MLMWALLAAGLVGWLWWKGYLGPEASRKLVLAAGAGLSAWLVARGQPVPGMAIAAATAALGASGWLRRRVGAQPMDDIAARKLLQVGLNANEAEILAAHRRMIARVHPDRGGDPDLARQVNAARDLLLSKLGSNG